MSKTRLYVFLVVCFFSCDRLADPSSQQKPAAPVTAVQAAFGDTIHIDLDNSSIGWKGTKMRRLGKHEGTIAIKHGYLILQQDRIIGAQIETDMTSISVTDIPETDPIPRDNLNRHLKSADFFDVDRFPSGYFSIDGVTYSGGDSLNVHGQLTLKNITQPIAFYAHQNGAHLSAHITIDRFQWDIAYTGSWANRTLVDRDIELKVDLTLDNYFGLSE